MQVTYRLHDSQYRIFSDDSRFVVLAAGRRFGKTVLSLTKAITLALATPKATIWYVAPTYKQAEMIAWKMLFEMIPAKLIAKKHEVKLEITFINGSSIALKGADNEDSLRGVSLDYVILDEYASMKPNVWQEIIRPMLSDRKGGALFIGTPKGKNHFWELFIKGQRKESGYSSYQMKTVDNPYIPRSEVKEAETQMNERYFRQEYEASFEDYTGLIWPEFSEKIHVEEPILDVPSWWDRVGTIDPAVTGTTAALWGAIDEDGCFHVLGEYYDQNKRVSEVSKTLKEIASRYKVTAWHGDPAMHIKKVSRDTGELYSFFDEYRDNGLYLRDAQNDVMAGINRVAEYFRTGKIKISRNCKNLIEEISRYHWSDDRETVLGVSEPKPFKSFDHACDCLRYMIMTRYKASQKPKPKSYDAALPMAGELLEGYVNRGRMR